MLAAHHSVDEVLQVAGLISKVGFPVVEIQQYLGKHVGALDGTYGSYWAKLACLCDYYAHGDTT